MPRNASPRSELGNTGYEIFVGALSVLSLVNIALLALLRSQATQPVVYVVDAVLRVVFLGDVLVRLRRAESRSGCSGWRGCCAGTESDTSDTT